MIHTLLHSHGCSHHTIHLLSALVPCRAVQWLGAHCAKKGQTKEWDNILALDCSLCAGMYTELHLNNAVKVNRA